METIEIIPPGARGRGYKRGDSDWADTSAWRRAALKCIDALSQLFDTAFVVPGTNVRFGIESIIPCARNRPRGSFRFIGLSTL
jgi:hypothetical protein